MCCLRGLEFLLFFFPNLHACSLCEIILHRCADAPASYANFSAKILIPKLIPYKLKPTKDFANENHGCFANRICSPMQAIIPVTGRIAVSRPMVNHKTNSPSRSHSWHGKLEDLSAAIMPSPDDTIHSREPSRKTIER